MTEYIKADSNNIDFQNLVSLLNIDLKIRDGEEHEFYAAYNKIDDIKNVVMAIENKIPVGCGAFKPFNNDTVEIKRMYVLPEKRAMGIATGILKTLEEVALSLNFKKAVLETGLKQPEAIALYKKNGYKIIDNYGQYIGVVNSVCFEKILIS